VSATEAKARIFDIQGFSLKDGPGIRTTVFFKGCPLRCRWCHNPESHATSPQLMFHANLCVGCMKCVEACKHGVHSVVLRDSVPVHSLDHEKCVGSGACVDVCCYGALTLVGREYTPKSLLAQVEKDFRYFALESEDRAGEGKGGLTFSGGEPMLYADFIAEFCSLIPNVHTAIETSGYAHTSDFGKLLECIDLFLFDFKIADPQDHEKWCGADNALILENLDFLYGKGKEICLRLPLIPGINDSASHIDAISALLKKYPGIKRAEILPYHALGLGKLEELGMCVDPAIPARSSTPESIQHWVDELRSRAGAEIVCL
jgi:pyruvate formate lyase activating enzyme